MERMICIVGPTATGKTRLSVALAGRLGAEIVSCDSMQLYRGMDIGTAKPTPEERCGVPHHMLDCLDPREDFSVSRYVELADACVQDIFSRGNPVLLVGGTGLYADSLVAGRQFAPYPQTGRREELTRIAETQGIEPLMERLRAVDPEAAGKIHPANRKRVIRALEVWLETGKTITEHNRETQQQPPKYRPCWIGLDYVNRSALNARIDRRVDEMFAQGLAEEVQRLLESGVPPTATSLQAIGYKELTAYLRGQGTLEEARERVKLATRQYAKRQRTWFRRNPAVQWILLPDEPDFAAMLAQAEALLSGAS